MIPLNKVGSSGGLMKGAGRKRPPLNKAHDPQLVWMALVFFPGISAMCAQTTTMATIWNFWTSHKIPEGTAPPSHNQYFAWAAVNALAGIGLWLCWLGNGFERHGEVVPVYVVTLSVNSYWFYVLFVEGRLGAAVGVGWAGLVAAAVTAGAMARAGGGRAAACVLPYLGAVAWLLRFATKVAAVN